MSEPASTLPAAFAIPRKATIEGTLIFSGPVVIEGNVTGDVRCVSVVITERGFVDGSIWAEAVTVKGEVTGDIFANTLVLKTACTVAGNIFHRHLKLEDGCFFEGKSRRHAEPLKLAQ
jgi:cytoskeletal protein CcmA (bactofilin family)